MFVLQTLFPIICSMSLIGGIVIILVLLVRLPFRRLPKIFSYLLWSVVLLRLLCPFTFSSHLSVFQVIGTPLIPQNQNIDLGNTTNSDYLGNAQKPGESASLQEQENQGYLQGLEPREMVSEKWLSATENAIEHTRVKIEDADITGKYTGRLQAFWKIGGIVWLLGAAALWIYSIVSIVLLQRQLVGAVREDKNIYLCDYIGTAFVWGIVHPRIYLPTTLAETEREYILLHEKTHIRRGDHIFRLLAFAALSIHWFNPLVWCAFFLSERDMEMACDEAVIRRMGKDFRAAYSASLLTVASGRRIFAGAPLGFGEGSVKRRIQNIMRYKKTAAFLAVPLLALVAVVCIMLGSNPASNEENAGTEDNNRVENNKEIELQSETNPIESEERELADTAEQISITAPVITADMMLGADEPSLDYVDEYTLIFHDYFGLFVFDMWENEVIGAVDLSAIGCQQTQGDNYCEVQVSQEGKMVYLHPLNREDMYIYDVREKTLTRQNYNYYNMEGIELFDKIKQTADCVNPDYTVWRSFGCVPLSGGRYVYLENGSGAIEDLFYIVEQADKQVKSAMIFEKYIDRKTDAQNALGYGDYTGYLDVCAKWSGYEEFVDQDYDGDGKIDHVYRENIVDFESCRYRIEFGNGDLLETMQVGSGIPEIQTCDLNGDGVKEMIFQQSYGFRTDPNAFGETVLFEKKGNRYQQIMLPKELCTTDKEEIVSAQSSARDSYTPSLALRYERLSEWEMRITTKDLTGNAKLEEEIAVNENVSVMFNNPNVEWENRAICYKTAAVNNGKRSLIEFHFAAFRKWSLDEIVVTAGYDQGALVVIGSRYDKESNAMEQTALNRTDYYISPQEAAVVPEVPLLSFAEASSQTQVLQFPKSKAGTLPGSDEGYWYSVTTDGVEYLYGKYDFDKEGNYQLFSWALRDASHKLANGLKVGISKEEALKLCPNLVRIEFDREGVVRWNRTAYPQNWTDEFDYMLVAEIEDNIDNLPQVLVLMIKGESVQAITIYAPTAG